MAEGWDGNYGRGAADIGFVFAPADAVAKKMDRFQNIEGWDV